MMKMGGNATKTTRGRILSRSFAPWAGVCIFVFFQIVVKDLCHNGVCNDGIPKTYAFSQSPWITTTQQPSIATRDGGSWNPGSQQIPYLTTSKRRSLVPLYLSTTSINITDSNIHKASTRTKRGNTQVRNIMSMLEERYDLPLLSDEGMDQRIKTREWKKTRNYLYHATRSHQDRSHEEREDVVVSTFEHQVVTVLDFLDERLQLPPNISRRVLQESPRILRKPVDSFLIPTADFLLQLWGRDLFVQAVERNPALLLSSGVGYTTNRKSKGRSGGTDSASSRDDIDANGRTADTSVGQSVEDILFSHAGLSSSAVKRIKGTAPFVFGLEVSKVHSVLSFLDGILRQKQEDATNTVTDEQTVEKEDLKRKKILGKVILAHPYLLNLCVESNLKPRLKFLAESCDLDPTQVAKVVQTSNGSVLSLSVEQNLKPTMEFLLQEIFHDDDDPSVDPKTMLKKCVLTHPQLLGLSLSNLKSKVTYFDSIGPSLAVRIARKCPAIYSLNLDQNIIPTIDFLARVWGMNSKTKASKSRNTNGDFLSMLHEYPNIITLSVETNLQPTMMFFNKTGYTLLNENWELISSTSNGEPQPASINGKHDTPGRIRGRYIAASLYNRLLPRWHFCLSSKAEAKNVGDDTESSLSALASAPPPEAPPLHLLVMASDDAFCQAMNFQPEQFLNFKKEAIPRLKFSSQFDTWLKTGKPIDL